MRNYLTPDEYLILTNDLKEMVDNKSMPLKTFELAFALAYDNHIKGVPFLKIYTEFMTLNPQADLKDLHAICLGYGTAGSVLDSLIDSKDDNKTYH